MHNQLDDVHTKLDLALGVFSLLLDKTTTTMFTTMPIPTTTTNATTPPHYIGQQPSTAAYHTPPLLLPLPLLSLHDIPPFPSFTEVTPMIDMTEFASTDEQTGIAIY